MAKVTVKNISSTVFLVHIPPFFGRNSAAGVASVNVITIQILLLDETVTSSLGNALTVCTTRLGLIVNGARLNSMEAPWTRPALVRILNFCLYESVERLDVIDVVISFKLTAMFCIV